MHGRPITTHPLTAGYGPLTAGYGLSEACVSQIQFLRMNFAISSQNLEVFSAEE